MKYIYSVPLRTLIQKIRNKFKKTFDTESKVLFRNSSWVFAGNAISTGLAFLKTVLIARILGVELLGIYTLSIAFVLTTQEFLRLNVAMGLIRFGAGFAAEGRKDKVVAVIKFSLLLSGAGGLLSVIVIALALGFAYDYFIKIPGLELYILLFAFANATSFFDAVSRACLKLHYKFKINSVIQVVMDLLEFGLVSITLLLYPKDLKAFFLASVAARFINSTVCNYAAYRELLPELRPWLKSRISTISADYKNYFKYILGNSFSSSLKVFMNQGDVLLLGSLVNTQAVGLYSTGKKLAYSVLTLTDPLASSVFPQFSHLVAKKEYVRIKAMLGKITLLIAVPALLILLFCYLVREPLLSTLYGKEFSGAADPFFVSLIGALQGSVFFWALPLIQSLGLIRKRFLVYLTAIVTGALFGLWLIPGYGATGAALALLAANLYITGRFVQASWRRLSEEKISAGNNKSGERELKQV